MALEHTLALTLQQLDANGAVMARRVETVDSTIPTVGQWMSGLLTTAAGEVTITLPTTQILQLLLKNTHTSAKITVKWTPTGGAEATTQIVGPAGIIAFWHAVTAATYGISSLKLTSDTNSGTYELFIGG